MNRQKYESYFNAKMRNVLEDLTLALLKTQPEQPIRFMREWTESRLQKDEPTPVLQPSDSTSQRNSFCSSDRQKNRSSECEVSESQYGAIEDEPLKKVELKKKFPSKQRGSISAEAFGKVNQRKAFEPVITPKEEHQKDSIRQILQKSFMFSSLEEEDMETVIGCMKKKVYMEGDYVIRQGDSGNELYIVSEGQLDCTKRFKENDTNETFLKMYKSGESFGELALLYHVPRQASIIAKQPCLLWELDRETFNSLVRDSVIKKKQHIKSLLKEVKIFNKMDDSEIERLVDSVKAETFEENQYICKEGDQGECLYIVDKGHLVAEKEIDGQLKNVFEYAPGSYFGEIALVCETTRKASIKCVEKCNLLSVGRNQFSRLIGIDEQILNDFSKYEGLQLK